MLQRLLHLLIFKLFQFLKFRISVHRDPFTNSRSLTWLSKTILSSSWHSSVRHPRRAQFPHPHPRRAERRSRCPSGGMTLDQIFFLIANIGYAHWPERIKAGCSVGATRRFDAMFLLLV